MLIGVDASRAAIAQRTGTEVYSLYLIRALLEIGTAHRFRLYYSAPPPPGLIPEAAHCERRVMPFPRLWTHLRLSLEMSAHPPDVLLVPAHVLPLVHPRRSVVTVHDLGHHYYPAAHTAGQRLYLEWSTRYHVRAAAHLLADSGATADDLVNVYGADPSRITVAHLGIDPALRPVRDAEAIARVQRKYGIHAPYLLYVGTLQPRKNLVRLIEAFGELGIGKLGIREFGGRDIEHGTYHPEFIEGRNTQHATLNFQPSTLKLVLAGKRGWLYDEILARAEALGLGERVVFPGFVDEADLPALYSGASLFVMPSLYEGFCMPVLEAMACGTPVVCSAVSSLPEIAGAAALTFDPHDVDGMAAVMTRVLGDGELRAGLIARGFERVRQFTWQRCARQVLDVLERMTAAAHPPAGYRSAYPRN